MPCENTKKATTIKTSEQHETFKGKQKKYTV